MVGHDSSDYSMHQRILNAEDIYNSNMKLIAKFFEKLHVITFKLLMVVHSCGWLKIGLLNNRNFENRF